MVRHPLLLGPCACDEVSVTTETVVSGPLRLLSYAKKLTGTEPKSKPEPLR